MKLNLIVVAAFLLTANSAQAWNLTGNYRGDAVNTTCVSTELDDPCNTYVGISLKVKDRGKYKIAITDNDDGTVTSGGYGQTIIKRKGKKVKVWAASTKRVVRFVAENGVSCTTIEVHAFPEIKFDKKKRMASSSYYFYTYIYCSDGYEKLIEYLGKVKAKR